MTPDPSHEVQRCHRAVLRQLDELIELAGDGKALDQQAPEISGWSIGEQLEHLAIVGQRVLGGLHKALDGVGTTEGAMTPGGEHVLAQGQIPRGKGQAPASVHPLGRDGRIIRDELIELRADLSDLGERLGELETSRVRWRHPYFGHLSPAEWLRFLEVHHLHHQAIIADIRRTA